MQNVLQKRPFVEKLLISLAILLFVVLLFLPLLVVITQGLAKGFDFSSPQSAKKIRFPP
ncbi:sulfate ABC transporter permease [Actinobacillus equuli]|nr:sulfate ABC transporter permease [Actinobacillus equuli]